VITTCTFRFNSTNSAHFTYLLSNVSQGKQPLFPYTAVKVKKLKSLYGAFQYLDGLGLFYSYPNKFPHSSPEARDLYQRRRELFPPIFASRSVIYKNPLGSFTCRKTGTWDMLFYFFSEGRHTDDFPASARFEPANSGSSGQYANH
jgi:hypothetical protein